MRMPVAFFLGVPLFVACTGVAFDVVPPGRCVGACRVVVHLQCSFRYRIERLQGSFDYRGAILVSVVFQKVFMVIWGTGQLSM